MKHNVGDTERIARLAIGAAAGAAAMAADRPWQKAALGIVAASGLATGFTRYCPMNQALGMGEAGGMRGDERRADADLRRDVATRAALGATPSEGGSTPPVTSEGNAFGSAGTH